MAKKRPSEPKALQVSAAESQPSPTSPAPVQSGSTFAAATGSKHELAQAQLLLGVLDATRISKDPKLLEEQVAVAVALLQGIKPQGELEGMLAAQMVATHMAAMDCLASAARSDTLQYKDMCLRHAEKLLVVYVRQLEALDKHRGKGQQNVTVGHVHVEQGGQAMVGSVQMGPGAPPPDKRLDTDRNSIESTVNADPETQKPSLPPSRH